MSAFSHLAEQVAYKKSRLVLGLDPEFEEKQSPTSFRNHLIKLINNLAPHIVGIKPNLAFYDKSYRASLTAVIEYTKRNHPNLKIILDVKRGDIANTQEKWAMADIANFHPDIVTINSYMGQQDTIQQYLKQNEDICVFALAATSNKDTAIQNMYSGGLKIYQHMALEARKADANRVGFVVGSTKTDAIKDIRAAELENGFAPENTAWVLAPGFGRQGGDLSFIKYAGPNTIYPISSGLTNDKYLGGVTSVQAAINWKNAINEASAAGYSMKSISEYFVEDLISNGILWIAENANPETWRTLNNGSKSPIYWDVRAIQSYPDLLKKSSYLLQKKISELGLDFNHIAAVPYGALGLGYAVAYDMGKPVITPRKEGAKEHGDKRYIVGNFAPTDSALIIEDVATSGKSTAETTNQLRTNGVSVTDAIVLIDRQQGAKDKLADDSNIHLHNVMTQTQAIAKLPTDHPMRDVVMKYLSENVK